MALAQAGAVIVAVGRSAMDETERLCREAGARFHSVQADLSTPRADRAHRGRERRRGGRIDILVNNAGIIRRADAIDFTRDRTGTT